MRLSVAPVEMTPFLGWVKGRGKGKPKAKATAKSRQRQRQMQRRMRGSLHCATDDEAVCCFGRDDAFFGVGQKERQRQQQRQPQSQGKGNGNGKCKDECGGLSTAQQTMRLSVAPVEMTPFLGGSKGEAKAKTTAKAKATAGPSTPLRFAQDDTFCLSYFVG